ncbi:Stf0 family sulfotransferase [Micromonospora inositola]|uniref:Trehalose 2-sulfotransferase n=1 Tax=Micromonospora inositola TaxID=47865 RepID=A0A1C5IUI4_9ACTN|nr:Stf0 family sulfotransferase [Micromonospora inositola]SCG61619.1 LPS sulfotransferase NodH [Micromonospora inositola]
MADVDSYFICATPRTGSSLLCGLLASTGVAGRPEAYFRVPDEPLWAGRWGLPAGGWGYGDFVAAALAAGRTGNGVFGAKLMWGTLDRVVEGLAAVHPELAGADDALLRRAFGRTAFVHLRRDDVLTQAVSWLRAEQTDLWYVGCPDANGAAPWYDGEGIDELIRTIETHQAAWEEWFAAYDVTPHRVRYEDLAGDPTGVTRKVLGFLGLGLPAGATIRPRHQRQADALNAEWVARHRAGSTGWRMSPHPPGTSG